MDLSKQKGNSSESQIQYEVVKAFSGEWVWRMCHCEENRLFVQSSDGVLELDISTTSFTKVKAINSGWGHGLCYVPYPHRLLVVIDVNEVRAVCCDDKKPVWTVNSDFIVSNILYTPTHKSIIVADWSRNRVVILS